MSSSIPSAEVSILTRLFSLFFLISLAHFDHHGWLLLSSYFFTVLLDETPKDKT